MVWSVLVVDDDPLIGLVVELALAREPDFTALMVESGAAALAYAATPTNLVDAVLLDCWLPDVDGYRLLPDLRCLPATRSATIFLTSADAQMSTSPLQSPFEPIKVLAKPFHARWLASQIREALHIAGSLTASRGLSPSAINAP